MSNMSELVKQLKKYNLTLIVEKDGVNFTSDQRGIAPLLELLKANPSFLKGASAADKVVGKSAALLYAKGKIKELSTLLLSEPALAVLTEHHISVEYEKLVPNIINRAGTDICPMEKRVLETSDPETAYQILKEAVQQMKNQK